MKYQIKYILALTLILWGCGNETSKEQNKLQGIDSWYWQLQGDLRDYKAKLYDIDLFDTPKETIKSLQKQGKVVICYLNAGAWENWREDADQFKQEDLGNNLDNWEGEKWLNIKSQNVQDIMLKRLDLAKVKGCDGIEPDNIDGYANNTGINLSYKEQLSYNKFLAKNAHKRGLLIALKNDLEQIKDLVNNFDLAINESCHKYNECNKLSPFIKQNKPVLNAEYDQSYLQKSKFKRLCKSSKKLGITTAIFSLDLDGTLYKSCKDIQ